MRVNEKSYMNFYSNYFKRLNSKDRFSVQNINKKIENFNSQNPISSAFTTNNDIFSGMFDNLLNSFNELLSNLLNINTEKSTLNFQNKVSQPIKSNSYPSHDTVLELQYGKVVFKDYDRDYDINESGEIGNKDNFGDDIDISRTQHDYDFNNDGVVDGNSTTIKKIKDEIINNHYFEKGENNIYGKLGIIPDRNFKVNVYFSDKLFSNEKYLDGVRALTVSSDDPKILLDLDEIVTKGNGVNPQVITHELTHAIMYSKLKNDNQAAWFMEGAAVYAAGQGNEKIYYALKSGGPVLRGLQNLEGDIKDIKGYAEAYLAFDYIEKFYGKDAVKAFVKNTLKYESVTMGIKKTFNINPSVFYSRAKDYSRQVLNSYNINCYA